MDKKTKHIFFDFDGTLCASEADIKAAWHKTFAELKISCPAFDELFRTGPSLQEMTDVLFPQMETAMKEKMQAVFKSSYDHSTFENTVPYPWITPWLEKLNGQGYSLYVVTNKRILPTTFLIQKCGWSRLFQKAFSQDSFPGSYLKKTALLQKALELLQINKDTALMIGDMSGDILAGKQNGIHSVGVSWGYGTREELADAGAEKILNKEDIYEQLY